MAFLLVLFLAFGSCLYFLFAALRTGAASDRLARRALMELATRENRALVDEGPTESPVLDRAEERVNGGYHWSIFI